MNADFLRLNSFDASKKSVTLINKSRRNKWLDAKEVIETIGFIVPWSRNPKVSFATETRIPASYAGQFNYCYTKGESHVKCPSYNETIGWLQKWRFTKGICSRKAAECPHCGVKLIWAKWPHRIINLGAFSLLLGMCSKYFFPIKIIDGFDLYFLFSILGTGLIIPGIYLLKFDVVGENIG